MPCIAMAHSTKFALYFMGYYWVPNIYQRLLGPWLGINPIEHYMIIVQPSLINWQFLTDCQYPVMSHKMSDTHN